MPQTNTISGTDDEEEIVQRLHSIANNTAGLGLIHKSQSIYSSTDYTRGWFAWVRPTASQPEVKTRCNGETLPQSTASEDSGGYPGRDGAMRGII
ncbi:hypothetical protein B0H14DRAFT_3466138 [Mycena olivaceomarginata]|nr:hypothetical protein B0H14DRAFT_3466138 [Mycena olivaceomarginata]